MTTAEIGAFTYRVTELILAIGAVHGHTYGGADQRKAWVLSVLAFGDDAAAGYAEAAGMLGGRVVLQATRGPSSHWFQRVNQFLGRKIITRWGTRKGAVLLGHLLPFGIGAVIGGTANVVLTNRIGRHADRFFRQLPAGLAALPPPPAPPARAVGLSVRRRRRCGGPRRPSGPRRSRRARRRRRRGACGDGRTWRR